MDNLLEYSLICLASTPVASNVLFGSIAILNNDGDTQTHISTIVRNMFNNDSTENKINAIFYASTASTLIAGGAIAYFATNYLPAYIFCVGISLGFRVLAEEVYPRACDYLST